MKRKNVDGFILASGFENTLEVEKLIAEKYPVAIVARDVPAFNVNAVCIDDFQGGYDAASYLIELGHQKSRLSPATSGATGKESAAFAKRWKIMAGFASTLSASLRWSRTSRGAKNRARLFELPDPPTAFLPVTTCWQSGQSRRSARKSCASRRISRS